jgi:hypothetical protein
MDLLETATAPSLARGPRLDPIGDTIHRLNEAYCVKRGIPITRHYRDDQLTEAHAALNEAERDIHTLQEESRHAETST